MATFTAPDMNSLPDDFAAIIDFGDGTTDTGAISGGGNFTVTADHVYAEKGTYAISIQIFNGLTGASTTTTTTAVVADGTLTLTGGLQIGVPATDVSENPFTVAELTDQDPGATTADYINSVWINWGDGHGQTAGILTIDGDGRFLISGSHTYANPYPNTTPVVYTATVTVTDVDGNSASTTDTFIVGNMAAQTPGTMGTWIFNDQNPNATASEFTVTADWGDGTTPSPCTVTLIAGGNGEPTQWLITAPPHTYAQDSYDLPNQKYQITVTVDSPDGDLTGIQYTSVIRTPMDQYTGNVDISKNLTVNNAPVAVFTVPDQIDTASELSAQIDWGDGTINGGSIQELAPGLFQVSGNHTYAAYDWYWINVTISQGWSGMSADDKGDGLAGGKPVIEFIRFNVQKSDFLPTQTLGVSNWQNAFEWTGRVIKLKRNFVNLMGQNFQVRVTDDAVKQNTVEVTVKSSSDDGHKITLTKADQPGVFKSPYLVLTTFATDQNAAGNQAVNVKLGDTVAAIYGEKKATATVPVQKVVMLHINILNKDKDKDPVAPKKGVEEEVEDANKIYASAGILFKIDGAIRNVNPPANVDLSDGLDSYLGQPLVKGKIPMTDEERNLLGDGALRAKDEINVYYVNYLERKNGTRNDLGESFWAAGVPEVVSRIFRTFFHGSLACGPQAVEVRPQPLSPQQASATFAAASSTRSKAMFK